MKINYLFILLMILLNLIFAQGNNQDEARLSDRIIFNEIDVRYNYDPYLKRSRIEGKYKRFFALMHESIYEPSNKQQIFANFI